MGQAPQQIRDILGPGGVQDGAGIEPYVLGGMTPEAVLFPADEEELSSILRLASAEGKALVPWGGGTMQHLGYWPSRLDWVIGTRRLSGVVEYQEADFVITARAGTTLGELNAFLQEHQQHLPLDPPEGDSATLGGIAAANASGPLRLGFGTPRDLILGMRVLLADGRPITFGARVVKSVAGYDLNKLYIGSLGILGVVSEITFKLYSQAAGEGSLLAGFGESEKAQAGLKTLLGARFLPIYLEWLQGEFIGEKAPSLPLEKLEKFPHVLGVGFSGNQAEVEGQQDRAESLLRQAGAEVFIRLRDQEATLARRSFSLQDSSLSPVDQGGLLLRLMVPLTWVGWAIERVLEEGRPLRDEGFDGRFQAHAGSGVVRVWFGRGRGALPTERVRDMVAGVRAAVREVGGHAILETMDSHLKETLDLWDEVSMPALNLELMRRAKAALDSEGLFNPGRFLGRI